MKLKFPKVSVIPFIISITLILFLSVYGVGSFFVLRKGWYLRPIAKAYNFLPLPVLVVNGAPVSYYAFMKEYEHRNYFYKQLGQEKSFSEIGQETLNQLIKTTVLKKQGRILNIQITKQEKIDFLDANIKEAGGQAKLVEYMKKFHNFTLDDYQEDLNNKLLEQKIRDIIGPQVHLQQIVVSQKNKKKFSALKKDLSSGKKTFDELVSIYSEDLTKEKNGDLGFIPFGYLHSTQGKAAFSLTVGSVSKPFIYKQNIYVYKLLEKKGENFADWFNNKIKNSHVYSLLKV